MEPAGKFSVRATANLMDLPGREAGKHRQIALMVQQQVKLYRPFGLSVLCPVKQGCAQLG